MKNMRTTATAYRLKPATAYLAAVMLVPAYVSMYPVWEGLTGIFDQTTLTFLPVAATLFLLVVIGLVFRHSFRQRSSSKVLVAAGALICFCAMGIPDPGFPAKKIHVAEYLLLSGVVRFAMSFKLQSTPLLFFSFLFTSILGIHDEFLQGFHSARTFGLHDMAVNAAGAGGGALIWHGLNLFARDLQESDTKTNNGETISISYLCWLILSTICFIWPCMFYTGAKGLPFWPATMLVAGTFYYSVYNGLFLHSMKHGISMVSFGAFSLVLYCPLSNVTNNIFF